ncbi:sulfite exporter TauE/SafE family protein [Oricola indica]|uniref:sulfite exporter TauE/SafE family protein n=1 Tax=Oricola indica TaxID=2872591 RepID=UPI001CBED10C|nr:sulfite exporter TauE/SafE family protein [Oricola indica]
MDTVHLLPEAISGSAAAILIATSIFTSATSAVFGLGGGVMMLVLMSLFMPVAALIPVHGVVQLGSNLGRAYHLRRFAVPSMILPFAAGGVIGALAGGAVVTELPEALLKTILAVFILVITWVKLPPLPLVKSPPVFAIGGAVTTALTIFLGATGPLITALMAKTFETRHQVVANAAVAMTIQHLLKVVAFGILGFGLAPWLPLACAMIVSGYAGTMIGARLLDTMDEARFRFWFRIGVTVLAVELLRRALF